MGPASNNMGDDGRLILDKVEMSWGEPLSMDKSGTKASLHLFMANLYAMQYASQHITSACADPTPLLDHSTSTPPPRALTHTRSPAKQPLKNRTWKKKVRQTHTSSSPLELLQRLLSLFLHERMCSQHAR